MFFETLKQYGNVMKWFFLLAIIGILGCTEHTNASQIVSGSVTKVRDADTVVVQGVPIRLNGVDAPENGTRAGNKATAAMKQLVSGKNLTCKLNGERTYDRWVGVCSTEDGRDIGAAMIASGLALDCRRYSGGRYRNLEPAGVRSRLSQAGYC